MSRYFSLKRKIWNEAPTIPGRLRWSLELELNLYFLVKDKLEKHA